MGLPRVTFPSVKQHVLWSFSISSLSAGSLSCALRLRNSTDRHDPLSMSLSTNAQSMPKQALDEDF